MATEILKSFGTLQSELEQARSSLKGVDESIKRLIGRDPSDVAPRALPIKRPVPVIEETRHRQRGPPNRRPFHENDEPPSKRRGSVFKRLSDRPNQYEDESDLKPQKQMISKVIVTPKEIPSRQEALAAQNNDEKSKARNRRMFGALLGTLQKFQQEETKLKSKEEKRAQVEKKIEEHEIREKAEIKKERQELFFNRKKKQAEIRMIELKMTRMKEYSLWEERQKPRMNFIQTKTKPHICYLPRKLNDVNKAALDECKNEVEKMIDKKRQDIFDDLQQIEERMRRNFDRKPKDEKHDEGMEEGDDKMDAHFEEDLFLPDNGLDEEMKDDHDNPDIPDVKTETNGNKLEVTEMSDNVEQPTEKDDAEILSPAPPCSNDENVPESDVKDDEERLET